MRESAFRWYGSALLVSVLSLSGLTVWHWGLPSIYEVLFLPLMLAAQVSLYAIPACLLAVGLTWLVNRSVRLQGRPFLLLSIALGSLSGGAVMLFEDPTAIAIAAAAGGTGGAMAGSQTPVFTRRGFLITALGVTTSLILLLALS